MKKTRFVNPTMFFFVNESLQMKLGKLAAQIAHAQEELTCTILKGSDEEAKKIYLECLEQNPRTVIVFSAKDADELYKISAYLESNDIITGTYVDEIGEGYLLSPTVMCTEYLDKEDPRVRLIFKMFKLYSPEMKILNELWEAYDSASFRPFFGPRNFEETFLKIYNRETIGKLK